MRISQTLREAESLIAKWGLSKGDGSVLKTDSFCVMTAIAYVANSDVGRPSSIFFLATDFLREVLGSSIVVFNDDFGTTAEDVRGLLLISADIAEESERKPSSRVVSANKKERKT